MNKVLVDSSVWISFFKGTEEARPLFELIDSSCICINDLILCELIPYLSVKKERNLIKTLEQVARLPMKIDWNEIIKVQTINIKKGINKVGIPDLLIMHNAVKHDAELYSFDKHFKHMSQLHGLKLYEK